MTVREGETAGAVVIRGGVIDEHRLPGRVRIPDHLNYEISVINDIFPFIQQHRRFDGRRVIDGGEFGKDEKIGLQIRRWQNQIGRD